MRFLRMKESGKPLSKRSKWFIGANVAILTLLGTMEISRGLVGLQAQADMPYLAAAVVGVSALHSKMGITAKDDHDPNFDAHGMLLASVRDERCATAMQAIAKYDSDWVGIASYKGREVRDHAVPVAVASMERQVAYSQGCTSRADVLLAADHYRQIHDGDMAIRSYRDVVRRLPVFFGWDHGPEVGSLMTTTKSFYAGAIDPEAVERDLCQSDARRAGVSVTGAQTKCGSGA